MPVDELLAAVLARKAAQLANARQGLRVFHIPDRYAAHPRVSAFTWALLQAKRGGASILAGGMDEHTTPGVRNYWFTPRLCRVRMIGGPLDGVTYPQTHADLRSDAFLWFGAGGHWGHIYRRKGLTYIYGGKTAGFTIPKET
jgi:hypothetical protein